MLSRVHHMALVISLSVLSTLSAMSLLIGCHEESLTYETSVVHKLNLRSLA